MKRTLRICLIVAILATATACTTPAPGGESSPTGITVTDALDRTVAWETPPQRIVIAGKANFMLTDAAYTFSEAPQRVTTLTQAKQATANFLSLLDPNYASKVQFTVESTAEEIATTNPDVVLLKRFMRDTVGKGLEALEIPVVYLDFETPSQYERDLAILGGVFANPDRAETVWDFYASRMSLLDETLADLAEDAKPSALVVSYNVKGEEAALEVPPEAWIQTQMVELAGGRPVWTSAGQGGWTVVNLEQIAAWNPDQIYVISYFDDVDAVVEALTTDPNWENLAAVQTQQVFGFPKDFYSWDQPDTRWILGLTWMATRMHPDRFAGIDMMEEMDAFYQELYGLDAETVTTSIAPLLEGDLTVR